MKVIVSVFSNLSTDQRVEKVCATLHEKGYSVELIGNSWGGNMPLNREYPTFRIPLKSTSLKTAYPEFNFKLYRELLKRVDGNTILLANDLDSLLANYAVSKRKNIPLVYDSHEIYTEMPSVQGRFTQKIWRMLERAVIKKIKYFITTSESYADWFVRTYHIAKPTVICNFPRKSYSVQVPKGNSAKRIIIYQGAINPSRGIDKVIPAMRNIQNAELWIFGTGPKLQEYKLLTKNLVLEDKVRFYGAVLPEELRSHTCKADIGLSVEENAGISYYYSLPNKISDYIQARVPVVTAAFPEMKKIVDNFDVGVTINSHSEQEIADRINEVLGKGRIYYLANLNNASEVLCWENEAPKLLAVFEKVSTENFH